MKPSKRKAAESIVKTLRQSGHEAYFVGGCVRDMVLGRKPYDFDIATSAKPKEISSLFKKTIPVGEAFGVMIVRLHETSFEVATFRRDFEYRDGRRPERVEFSDARNDCYRRDFTVNGLFFDPAKRRILDWVGGRKDAGKRIIRTIGPPRKRFEEDKLRMLRAVRFAANLDFKIEPKTLSAIKEMRSQIRRVSPERVRDELIKLFTGPHPDKGMDWLDKSGLLKEILPEISALKGVRQPKQFHPEGDVYKHTRLMMSYLNKPDIVLAFGSLLHDVGKPPTFRQKGGRIRFNGHDRVGARMADMILTRLKFSNEHKRRIVACVEWHMQFKDAKQMRQSRLKRMLQRETFVTELDQHRADCLASHKNLGIWRFLKKVLKTLSQEQIKPDPFIKGRDLIDLGLKPGPQFGKILTEAEEKQLEGDLKNREDALAWAKKFAR